MTKIGKPRTPKGLAVFCAKMAQEKIADNIIILDMNAIDSAPAEYFVLCSCDSEVQVRALSEAISRKCKDLIMPKPRIEGFAVGYWVLLDFFDVVLHIMLPEARSYYNIEKLWGDAKFLSVNNDGKTISIKRKDFK